MLPPQQGAVNSPLEAEISGKTFQVQKNKMKVESVSLVFEKEHTELNLRVGGGDFRLTCGHGEWLNCIFPLYMFGPQPAAASGAWKAPDTYEAKVCLPEAPFVYTMTFHFIEKQVEIALVVNVNFGPTAAPLMKGKMK